MLPFRAHSFSLQFRFLFLVRYFFFIVAFLLDVLHSFRSKENTSTIRGRIAYTYVPVMLSVVIIIFKLNEELVARYKPTRRIVLSTCGTDSERASVQSSSTLQA